MAWLYSKSSTWRRIVGFTQRSPLYMVGFAGLAFAVPAVLGGQVMQATNSPQGDSALEAKLRAGASIDGQMLARAQKARLQVLLDETRAGKGGARYKAALDGQSLGTHHSGSTAGAVAIKKT
jgi:hypothetical protein